jgi:hypothetical protein
MRRRAAKPEDLADRFRSTCAWCRIKIPPGKEVFGGGGKARPELDLTGVAGQVIPMTLRRLGKTILVGIAGLDSEARRDGYDFAWMTCSRACAERLQAALRAELDAGSQSET